MPSFESPTKSTKFRRDVEARMQHSVRMQASAKSSVRAKGPGPKGPQGPEGGFSSNGKFSKDSVQVSDKCSKDGKYSKDAIADDHDNDSDFEPVLFPNLAMDCAMGMGMIGSTTRDDGFGVRLDSDSSECSDEDEGNVDDDEGNGDDDEGNGDDDGGNVGDDGEENGQANANDEVTKEDRTQVTGEVNVPDADSAGGSTGPEVVQTSVEVAGASVRVGEEKKPTKTGSTREEGSERAFSEKPSSENAKAGERVEVDDWDDEEVDEDTGKETNIAAEHGNKVIMDQAQTERRINWDGRGSKSSSSSKTDSKAMSKPKTSVPLGENETENTPAISSAAASNSVPENTETTQDSFEKKSFRYWRPVEAASAAEVTFGGKDSEFKATAGAVSTDSADGNDDASKNRRQPKRLTKTTFQHELQNVMAKIGGDSDREKRKISCVSDHSVLLLKHTMRKAANAELKPFLFDSVRCFCIVLALRHLLLHTLLPPSAEAYLTTSVSACIAGSWMTVFRFLLLVTKFVVAYCVVPFLIDVEQESLPIGQSVFKAALQWVVTCERMALGYEVQSRGRQAPVGRLEDIPRTNLGLRRCVKIQLEEVVRKHASLFHSEQIGFQVPQNTNFLAAPRLSWICSFFQLLRRIVLVFEKGESQKKGSEEGEPEEIMGKQGGKQEESNGKEPNRTKSKKTKSEKSTSDTAATRFPSSIEKDPRSILDQKLISPLERATVKFATSVFGDLLTAGTNSICSVLLIFYRIIIDGFFFGFLGGVVFRGVLGFNLLEVCLNKDWRRASPMLRLMLSRAATGKPVGSGQIVNASGKIITTSSGNGNNGGYSGWVSMNMAAVFSFARSPVNYVSGMIQKRFADLLALPRADEDPVYLRVSTLERANGEEEINDDPVYLRVRTLERANDFTLQSHATEMIIFKCIFPVSPDMVRRMQYESLHQARVTVKARGDDLIDMCALAVGLWRLRNTFHDANNKIRIGLEAAKLLGAQAHERSSRRTTAQTSLSLELDLVNAAVSTNNYSGAEAHLSLALEMIRQEKRKQKNDQARGGASASREGVEEGAELAGGEGCNSNKADNSVDNQHNDGDFNDFLRQRRQDHLQKTSFAGEGRVDATEIAGGGGACGGENEFANDPSIAQMIAENTPNPHIGDQVLPELRRVLGQRNQDNRGDNTMTMVDGNDETDDHIAEFHTDLAAGAGGGGGGENDGRLIETVSTNQTVRNRIRNGGRRIYNADPIVDAEEREYHQPLFQTRSGMGIPMSLQGGGRQSGGMQGGGRNVNPNRNRNDGGASTNGSSSAMNINTSDNNIPTLPINPENLDTAAENLIMENAHRNADSDRDKNDAFVPATDEESDIVNQATSWPGPHNAFQAELQKTLFANVGKQRNHYVGGEGDGAGGGDTDGEVHEADLGDIENDYGDDNSDVDADLDGADGADGGGGGGGAGVVRRRG